MLGLLFQPTLLLFGPASGKGTNLSVNICANTGNYPSQVKGTGEESETSWPVAG